MPPHPRRPTPYARDGVCMVRAFLPADDFARIQEDCRRLRGRLKPERDAMAIGRVGCFLDRRSETHRLLTSAAVEAEVSRRVGQPMAPSTYPIELRSYRVGAEMAWHQDDQLYAEPQCELVLCLDNDSDSRTEWVDAQGERFTEWTPPNAALLVRGGTTGASHRVTPLRRGARTILKMVWTVPGSEPLPELYSHLDSLPGLRRKVRRTLTRGERRRR